MHKSVCGQKVCVVLQCALHDDGVLERFHVLALFCRWPVSTNVLVVFAHQANEHKTDNRASCFFSVVLPSCCAFTWYLTSTHAKALEIG